MKSLNKAIRKTFRYKSWRTFCFRRDLYTCQECGKRGGRLNVDHIKPFSLILKENKILSVDKALNCKELWSHSNGRTLCLKCHRNTETFGLKARNYLTNVA